MEKNQKSKKENVQKKEEVIKKDNKVKNGKVTVEQTAMTREMKQETVKETGDIKKSKKRMWIVIAFLVFVFIAGYIMLRGSYLETLGIGEEYVGMFWQNLKYMSITFITTFAFLFVVIYKTNTTIRKGLALFFKAEKKDMPKLPNKSISLILSLIVSLFTSKMILSNVLLCFSGSQFEQVDPIFNLDISFFMFQKPLIQFLLTYLLVVVIGTIVYAVIYYLFVLNKYFDGISRETVRESNLIGQLTSKLKLISFLLAGMVLVMALDLGLSKFINITDKTNTYSIFGAGVTDVTIKLWGYVGLAILIVVSIFMAVNAFNKGKKRKILGCIFIVPIYLIVLTVVMATFQILFVDSNELDKEKEYIAENIKATRNAYGININEVNLDSAETISDEEVKKNQNVVNNIPIVSDINVLEDLKISQKAKGYYTYRTTQSMVYTINSKPSLVYVTPREISSTNATYNNKTYEYTHGYGIIVTDATTTDKNGNINNIQKNFGEVSEVIAISEPRIYFGLETNDTVVTNSKDKKEFDYPDLESSENQNVENKYDGIAGLNLSFLDRIILAIKEGDSKLAFSGNVNKDSKIITNRNVLNRVKTLMPYIYYDQNPYLVIDDSGKQVWVIDGYTMSSNYPYSQKMSVDLAGQGKSEINYIRNSVKVLVDAYDGTTKFYITDRNDPIVMAYSKMYPDLFQEKDEKIAADISEHFVYPEFLYNIQSSMIERYHNVTPDVLYRNDDVWDGATHNIGRTISKTGTDMEPYYTMIKTTDSDKEYLGLVLPYTPYGRQNIISYLVGSYEEGETPKLTLYKYPTDSNVLGPMQLDTQLEQDEKISSEIASLNVNGTKITKNMIVVPINNNLLYIEPIYQQSINEKESEQKSILKKVAVASGNKVAIGDDLTEALKNLLSQYATDIEVENTENIDDLMDAIIKANNNLEVSNSNNDWEMIGKDMKKLNELIKKLDTVLEEKRLKDAQDTNTTTNDVINNEINDILNNQVVNQNISNTSY